MFFSSDRTRDAVMDQFNQTYLFEVERKFDEELFRKYIKDHRSDCFMYIAVYLVFICGGKYFMKNRDRFELRPLLATWSGLLAIFSIIGAIRTIPEMVKALSRGFEYSCCSSSFLDPGSVTCFWASLFTLSKVLELGDTVFIVLRKQQLIFLHWYHHITVLCYVWISYPLHIGYGRWFMVMNFCVHSLMYSYFALRAMRFSIPKWVNMSITLMQLVQMMAGVTVNIKAYLTLAAGRDCDITRENITYSLLMYLSYLMLFIHFFYSTYIAKKPAREKTQ